MQQRYYDPQIGRFLSTDPARSEFNLFNYARNNPFLFVDPDGRVAKAESREKADAVEAEMNNYTSVEYRFDENLTLQRTTNETGSEHTSELYEDAIDAMIADDNTATIEIAENRSVEVAPGIFSGQDIDACCGGGETLPVGSNGDVRITVSPNSQSGYTDLNGHSLPYRSPDIMLHEVMVHAVPIMTGATTNQSALSIENPARVQAEVRQRGSGDHGTLKPQLP